MKKRLCLLSEERLSPREVKTCVFVPPFFLLFKNALMGLPSFHSGYPAFLQKNGGKRGIRTLGSLRPGGFQDRCLKPLDHLSVLFLTNVFVIYTKCTQNAFFSSHFVKKIANIMIFRLFYGVFAFVSCFLRYLGV